MRRAAERLALGVVVAAVAALGALALASGGTGTPRTRLPAVGAAGWQGLLGGRPAPQLGDRQIVVLRLLSLADRVQAAGGTATEAEERAWTREARAAQRRVLARLARAGAQIVPEESYVRVLNGFSVSLDARALGVVERDPDVAGVFPVRAAYPAAVSEGAPLPAAGRTASQTGVVLPGFDGRGVVVALLDTGIDVAHPFVAERLLPGIDVLEPTAGAIARENPLVPGQLEAHATELAGLVVGAGGPNGLQGVAPGASLLPIRVAGWQPDVTGAVAVYGRSDQVLAGIEAAVDPDGNGDAHDAARVALVGVVEPDAAFADDPLALGVAGAQALDTLVVAPVGNDGAAGPTFGTVGGPGGAPAALTVGALDQRPRSPTAHVLLRTGLRVLLQGAQPLGGSAPPHDFRTTDVTAPGAAGSYFDSQGLSTVAGKAVLLPPGATSPPAVREAVSAGAAAVLVNGPIPPGALGADESGDVPVLGVPAPAVAAVRLDLRRGRPVQLSVGAASLSANAGAGAAAPFASHGLAFDGGLKPEIAAPGVELVTSDPGRDEDGSLRYGTVSGSSAATAIVAGAAALLAEARPDLDAAGLKAALVQAAARPAGQARSAVGTPDVAAAASAELVADPPALALGTALANGTQVGAEVTLRNVSRRRLDVRLDPASAGSGAQIQLEPAHVALGPGESAPVSVTATVPTLPEAPGALTGAIRVVPEFAAPFPLRWAIAVPVQGKRLLGGVRLSQTTFVPSDVNPARLSVVAGRVDGAVDDPQLMPLARLDLVLYRGGRSLGELTSVRDLLPGRYAFGLTGRDARGRRLRPGEYELQLVATPVAGDERDEATVPFRIR